MQYNIIMNYILSTSNNSYGIVDYDHNSSPDYTIFNMGIEISELEQPLIFNVKDKSKLRKFHILSSTGPELVSKELRKVIEEHFYDDIEFFQAELISGNDIILDYSAINVKTLNNCFDLEKSDYKLTNFDPSNPTYRFYTQVVKDEKLGANIVRSSEQLTNIIVNEDVIEKCKEAKISGLCFYKILDITPNDLSEFECI